MAYRSPTLVVRILLLATILLGAGRAVRAATVELRDITVTPDGTSATITFTLSGAPETVVVEQKKNGVAQVRMKSLRAGSTALKSAAIRPGVLSVQAHIERTDVLVTNVKFTRAVTGMKVLSRTGGRIQVQVALGRTISPGTVASSPGGTKKGSSGAARERSAGKTSEHRQRWSLTTIVIDPGHGGKDPGAIGLGDVEEKDVTLAVARRLREEIQKKMPGVRVVMTREDDRFVELFRRGQIANEREGRLFISIHCNSMPEKPHAASGFECYILRPGKSEDAARVVAAENAAIRFERDTEKYLVSAENAIVAGMAQNAFIRYSEWLANSIRKAMRGRTGIPDRGVHQAGFYVLVGASMPSVLVELGYLSNENDVKVLKSSAGQRKMARAIFQGIKEYEKAYSASLK